VSLYDSAWFGLVWGGILGGIARVGFSHRESALPDPLNSRAELEKEKIKTQNCQSSSRRSQNEVFEVFETIRAEISSAELVDPPPGSSSSAPTPGSSEVATTEEAGFFY
jgi:Na+/glutamate symporter